VTARRIFHDTAPVIENVRLARDTYRLRVQFPTLAATIRPGQFLMLRLPGRSDPLLGRAFALYETADEAVDVVYLVVGKMTRLMVGLRAGDPVEVWGPLGNGFPDYAGVKHLVLVAGGIGQTPFPSLTRRVLGRKTYGGQSAQIEVAKVSVFYGARTADYFAGLEDFHAAGAGVELATDDGSIGYHGFVTQLLEMRLSQLGAVRLIGCGPEPMLQALARLASTHSLPCDLSLETPMACGVGICFSCVTTVKTADGWDYRRVCVEGPVFDAKMLQAEPCS
jgi:dihydroorotate dehydrogenase electron transfer subunit